MCNRYTAPDVLDVERTWNVTGRNPLRWWDEVVPLRPGPYIKPGGILEVGQWGMIPPGSTAHRTRRGALSPSRHWINSPTALKTPAHWSSWIY